jgi:hypothetical protein
MSVTVSVYYRNGLKRGPGCNNATFGQWLVLQPGDIFFPGVWQYVDLPVRSRSGNVYVVDPQTAPLDPASNRVTLRAATIGEGTRDTPVGAADFAADNGTAVEVWV